MAAITRENKINLSQKVFFGCTLSASILLAIGCLIMGSWLWVLLVISCGIFWLFEQRKGWTWVASLELLFFVFASIVCTLSGVSAGLILIVLASILCAWDLDSFNHRLKGAASVEKKDQLERNHLKRLITVIVFGSIFCVPALFFEIHLQFGWILLLGIIVLLGIIWLISQMTHEDERQRDG